MALPVVVGAQGDGQAVVDLTAHRPPAKVCGLDPRLPAVGHGARQAPDKGQEALATPPGQGPGYEAVLPLAGALAGGATMRTNLDKARHVFFVPPGGTSVGGGFGASGCPSGAGSGKP